MTTEGTKIGTGTETTDAKTDAERAAAYNLEGDMYTLSVIEGREGDTIHNVTVVGLDIADVLKRELNAVAARVNARYVEALERSAGADGAAAGAGARARSTRPARRPAGRRAATT